MSNAVADAGPIIHLHELDRLQLLEVFDIVAIPDAVWRESTIPGRVRPQSLLKISPLRRHSVDEKALEQFIEENNLSALQRGELESFLLCQHLGIEITLTDDLAARNAAKRLNLRPVGSLGIIVRACHQEIISLADAERLMWKLYDKSSLFITQVIVELAITQLRASEQHK